MRIVQKPPGPIGSHTLILFALLFPAATLCQTRPQEAMTSTPEPPLRLSETMHDVAADLDRFVPEYMHEQNIPGVSITLVRDGTIAWSKGYGVANTITREGVTEHTLFEVASNSKVVAAYIALRLADQ
jgi:CubicO group peptidase (beta-lactamase class C family)